MTLQDSTTNPGQPFVHLFGYRKGGLPFDGAHGQIYFQAEETDIDSSGSLDAFSTQHNVWGGNFDPVTGRALDDACHWYQAVVLTASGKTFWRLEGFTIPKGDLLDPNVGGEFEVGFSPPQRFNLSAGDVLALSVIEDTGVYIRARLILERISTGDWLYDSTADPNVKGSPVADSDGLVSFGPKTGRSPLRAQEMFVGGFGSSSRASFTQGSFYAKLSTEPQADDLTYGGTWTKPDGTPDSDNLAGLLGGTGTDETGNVAWRVQNPNGYEIEAQGVLT